jgi:hypothetical protein
MKSKLKFLMPITTITDKKVSFTTVIDDKRSVLKQE